jgi:hypothetical protein
MYRTRLVLMLNALIILMLLTVAGAQAQDPTQQGQLGIQGAPVTTGFTYQGQIKRGGVPVNGTCDFEFILYDAPTGGSQVGAILEQSGVGVSNGNFVVKLDFGANVFNGEARWLQVAVKCPGDEGLILFSTRQELTPAPYALTLVPGAVITASGRDSLTARSDSGRGLTGFSATGVGVWGGSDGSNGVEGISHAQRGRGIYGFSDGKIGDGVDGISVNGGFGVRGTSYGAGGAGVVGFGTGPGTIAVYGLNSGGEAGEFDGDVLVAGTLTKFAGSFKIDHPLEPAHKYLSHSFVESPDMMNIYNGIATLDQDGTAIVALPAWFEALNRDFRYQLTPIGAPGPNLYIAQEIRGNRFTIAGGASGMKVSWQVTGIRHDPYAEAHRIPVEEDKPAVEQGVYLYPEGFGQPQTLARHYALRQHVEQAPQYQSDMQSDQVR